MDQHCSGHPESAKDQTQQDIKLYDTLNNVMFSVYSGMTIPIYICGPTVYTNTHIGHLKAYMTFDIIRRVLEKYFRVHVHHMMNITNVDDKIIKGTYEKEYGDDINLESLTEDKYLDNQKFVDFANYWEYDFFKVMDSMNIHRPHIVGRVTEYIKEIFDFVEVIDMNGYAFVDDGSVYFYGTKYGNVLDENKDKKVT